MPIIELDNDHLDQQCVNCNAKRRLIRPSLQGATFGVLEPTEDPYVLALPPCETCGAREFLIRSRGTSPDKQSHQRLVDHLFDRLSEAGEEMATTTPMRNRPAFSPASTKGGT